MVSREYRLALASKGEKIHFVPVRTSFGFFGEKEGETYMRKWAMCGRSPKNGQQWIQEIEESAGVCNACHRKFLQLVPFLGSLELWWPAENEYEDDDDDLVEGAM